MNKPLHVAVINVEASVRSQIQALGDNNQLRVEDLDDLKQMPEASAIDVILLGEGSTVDELAALSGQVDLSKTVVLGGPISLVEGVAAIRELLESRKNGTPAAAGSNLTLEDYVEAKFGEFVRAMKASSSRTLYSTLIQAVERPLIELALRETHGNQIQAAQLLGLNRNTLRKKIIEGKISVKRRPRTHRGKEGG